MVIGLDVSYKKDSDLGCAAAVAIRMDDLKIVDYSTVVDRVYVPYIPGFLAFREAPLMIRALKKILGRVAERPLLIINGHGVSHPRRFGIASHIGVVMDLPSIGVARSMLAGEVTILGGREVIVLDNRVVGIVLRSRKSSRRFYVSIGHKVSIEDIEYYMNRFFSPDLGFPKPPYPVYVADKISREALRGGEDLAKWLKKNRHLLDPDLARRLLASSLLPER